jgi:hypothetical protein
MTREKKDILGKLTAGISDLDTSLTNVDGDNFTHCFFVVEGWEGKGDGSRERLRREINKISSDIWTEQTNPRVRLEFQSVIPMIAVRYVRTCVQYGAEL